MTDPLERLLGSKARVRLMRLFLFNPHDSFSVGEAALRARVARKATSRELNLLRATGLIKRMRRGRLALNEDFAYRSALQVLLINGSARAAELPARVRAAGPMRLIVVAGAFVGELDASLDLLFVGERIDDRKLRTRVRAFESELGRELRYACLSTQDFFYRLNVSDKLLRDVLDYPHLIVLDRLHIGLK